MSDIKVGDTVMVSTPAYYVGSSPWDRGIGIRRQVTPGEHVVKFLPGEGSENYQLESGYSVHPLYVTKVEVNPDQVWEMTLEIARHHRLDPNTKDDRCTCGHRAKLGHMFTHHIAQELARQGWTKA